MKSKKNCIPDNGESQAVSMFQKNPLQCGVDPVSYVGIVLLAAFRADREDHLSAADRDDSVVAGPAQNLAVCPADFRKFRIQHLFQLIRRIGRCNHQLADDAGVQLRAVFYRPDIPVAAGNNIAFRGQQPDAADTDLHHFSLEKRT